MASPAGSPIGFAGGVWDADTGLVRFGARDYDPRVGRWTAKDPLGFDAPALKFYDSAAANPISARDPFGQAAIGERSEVDAIEGGLMRSLTQRFSRITGHSRIYVGVQEDAATGTMRCNVGRTVDMLTSPHRGRT